MDYKIADLLFRFDGMQILNADRFLCTDSHQKEPDCVIKKLFQSAGHYGVFFDTAVQEKHALKKHSSLLLANEDWSQVRLSGRNDEDNQALLLSAFYSHLATRQGFAIRGSLIKDRGIGVLLVGKGEETVFVRKLEDGFYGYGSPWCDFCSGSGTDHVKLQAAAVLTQGEDIQRDIVDKCYLPQWDPAGMESCRKTLHEFLAQIPAVRLSCNPDEEIFPALQNALNL